MINANSVNCFNQVNGLLSRQFLKYANNQLSLVGNVSERSSIQEIIFNMHKQAQTTQIKNPTEYAQIRSLVKEYKYFTDNYRNKNRSFLKKILYVCLSCLYGYNKHIEQTLDRFNTIMCEYRTKRISNNAKFHGTVLSTLFIMGKIQEPHKNCLISFKTLFEMGVPCFAGECGSGIKKNGVNQQGTSWTNQRLKAKSYATGDFKKCSGSRFDINRSEECLKSLIAEWGKFQKDGLILCYPRDSALFWDRYILSVRRQRQLDDVSFQSKYKSNLLDWAKAAKLDAQKNLTEINKTIILPKIELFIEELTKNMCPLAANVDESCSLRNITPVVFVANNMNENDKEILLLEEGGDEFVASNPVKLGEHITCIFTSDVEAVHKHLCQQNLAALVDVFDIEDI